MFLLLPEELIKAISSEMDIQDVKSLRLTCKALSEMLASQVLHSITINWIDRHDMDKLQCLATRPCTSATTYATHKLTIQSLSPSYLKPYEMGEDSDSQTSHTQTQPEALCAIKVLFDALSSFQNVQSVSWQPHPYDATWAQTTLMDALKTLNKIRSLHVSIIGCGLEVPFHWFSDLQEISIDGTSNHDGEHYHETLENLAKMVAHSPQLNSIHMKNMIGFRLPAGKTQSLRQLFQYYSKDVLPLRLHRLVLDSCLVRFDDITTPHLKYLTSLSLTNIKEIFSGPTYIENHPSIKRLAEQRRWGSSLQEIWSALIKADIFLEEITVDLVVHPLIAYLASYSGLKIFNLYIEVFDETSSNDLAAEFYAKALSNHVQSLRTLNISAAYDGHGLWCIGEHNLSLISQCINLKHLAVSVISSQVDSAPPIGSSLLSSAGLDVLRRIIDMVATSIPQLDTLDIKPAALEGSFGPRDSEYTCGKIVSRITTYLASPSCRRLPLLSVGLKQFMQCQVLMVDTRRLGYMPCPNNPPHFKYVSEIDSEIDSDNDLGSSD